MKQPYYMINFSASACLFEFRVNDQPVLSLEVDGQASTRIPINYAISANGRQKVSVKILPLQSQNQLSKHAEINYTIRLYDVSNGFEYKESFDGFESKKIEDDENLSFITGSSDFIAEIPYQLRDYWKKGEDINKIDNLDGKLRASYIALGKLITKGDISSFKNKMANREFNMVTSMFLSNSESEARLKGLIGDVVNNGFDYMELKKETFPVISAFNKKVALKTRTGEPALRFINKEKREQLMLDVEFYFNKETNQFEVI